MSQPGNGEKRDNLERLWFATLQKDRDAYRRAAAKLKAPPDPGEGPKSEEEIQALKQLASEALVRYQQTLKLFTDLVSKGGIAEPPKEDD